MSDEPPVVVWFRQDLRLADNPALAAAAATGQPLLAVYVLDDQSPGDWKIGAASRWWLHHSLAALDSALNSTLCLLRGRADEMLPALIRDAGATALYCNATPEPWQIASEAAIGRELAADGIALHSFNGSTLFDPERVLKADGTPYRVFTPFYRKGCLENAAAPREPIPVPDLSRLLASDSGTSLSALGLMPAIDWYQPIEQAWQVGEKAALARLDRFLDTGLRGYRDGRNFPAQPHVSRLSPHLHFGEISPNQAWHALTPFAGDAGLSRDIDSFRSELGWREFSRYLLTRFPGLPEQNFQSKFDRFPWRSDEESLLCWQRGATGYPMVDAGMRELWQTGYMHNRVRMIVGSFLIKNLLLHWRHGEDWFWDTLVDADLASNSASWQWVAGSGADAAPYFRIFNPVTQGLKFDPDGDYVRRFVPELKGLEGGSVHEPWKLPRAQRESLAYPEPMIDLKATRERALAAFKAL